MMYCLRQNGWSCTQVLRLYEHASMKMDIVPPGGDAEGGQPSSTSVSAAVVEIPSCGVSHQLFHTVFWGAACQPVAPCTICQFMLQSVIQVVMIFW